MKNRRKQTIKLIKKISREFVKLKPTVIHRNKKKYNRKRDKRDIEREAWKEAFLKKL